MPKAPTGKGTARSGVKIEGDVRQRRGNIAGRDINETQNIKTQNIHIHEAGSSPRKKEIPRLLPYKIDRRDQEKRLREIYEGYRSDAPLPIVTVVHGDEEQAVDTFLERLREDFIPRRLIRSGRARAKPERVQILSLAVASRVDELHERIEEGLVESLLGGKGKPDLPNIQKRLARSGCPTIVEILLSENFIFNHRADALDAILSFWDQWPSLAAGQLLFVFVYFIYAKPPESAWRVFLRRNPKPQIQSYLTQFSFQKYARTVGGLLPELGNVPRDEADIWARGEEANRYCRDLETLLAKIRELYMGAASRPMAPIAASLRTFLEEDL